MEHQGTALLEKGRQLGKYEIARLIGVGSMGAVYEGLRTGTRERFAIKVLDSALAAIPTARARFLKEAKLTGRVRHAHIVDVTDVAEDAGLCYFAMELLEGEDLASRLRRSGPLSAAETVDIMLPVCDAVAEAHRCGITHRDLKPSNIFLAIREGRQHPVVLDFGIAKDGEGGGVGDAGGAVPGRLPVFGTPYYLAPEQIADHRAAGPASDQYALGIILYECLTGQPPFRGDHIEEVFQAIVAGNPAPPSTLRPLVPREIDAVVLRALSLDPKARFTWVAALGRALRAWAALKPAGTTPVLQPPPPSSPAIDVEASTPSPFVKTLTPEVQTISGAWFAAAEQPEESSGETTSPAPGADDWEPDPEREITVGGWWKLASRRVWIGAAAGVALSSLALALVLTRGRSSAARSQPMPTAEALVQIEPAPPRPPTDNVVAAPAAQEPKAEEPRAEEPRVEQPNAEAAPVAAVVAPPLAAPIEVPAAVAPAPARDEAPTPAAVLPVAPRELPATAPREAPTGTGTSRARTPADRPRARANGGVRMHNGVPLLD